MFAIKAFLLALCASLAVGDGKFPPGPDGISTNATNPASNSTTAAPITTTVAPKTTTLAPNTTTAAPNTTTVAPKTTTLAPNTTTAAPKTTTLAPNTTTAAPNTTTVAPKTTTLTPNTTTAAPTTPKPTPAPVNPVGSWTVNYTKTDRSCLVLKAAIEIDLPYKEGNSSKTITVKVPSGATATGTCQANVDTINLLFGLSGINLMFKKSDDSKKYDLDSIVATLNVSIPGVNGTLIPLTHVNREFSTPISSSYKCAKEQSLNLISTPKFGNYTAFLRISSFQVQAFRNSSDAKFDSALDCQSYETPDVVPIAVGCALAALVIVVLVAYLIGRRRSQARGYLSM